MNTVANVLDLIVPKGVEYTLIGEPTTASEYADALIWHSSGSAPTWSQIQLGFSTLQSAEADKAAAKAAAQAKLAALGLTTDDLAALGL